LCTKEGGQATLEGSTKEEDIEMNANPKVDFSNSHSLLKVHK
jgi:hypothetical protein